MSNGICPIRSRWSAGLVHRCALTIQELPGLLLNRLFGPFDSLHWLEPPENLHFTWFTLSVHPNDTLAVFTRNDRSPLVAQQSKSRERIIRSDGIVGLLYPAGILELIPLAFATAALPAGPPPTRPFVLIFIPLLAGDLLLEGC